MHRLAGVAAAVFPNDPERSVYNNALLERDLAASERADAVFAMEAAYDAAGVARFIAWVHERDAAIRSDVERRRYTVDEVTRAMGVALDDIRSPKPDLELGRAPPLASVISAGSSSTSRRSSDKGEAGRDPCHRATPIVVSRSQRAGHRDSSRGRAVIARRR